MKVQSVHSPHLEPAVVSDTEAVPLSDLRELLEQAIGSLGYTEKEVDVIVEAIMWSQLRGNSQGVIKIPSGAFALPPGAGPAVVVQDSPGIASIDGQQCLGMLALHRATRLAVAKAKQGGVGVVGVNNTASTTGALGHWVEQIAEAGMVGVIMCQSPEYVAPHGSTEAIFGTNPIAVGCPTDEGPLLIDLATSAQSWYSLFEAREKGKTVGGDIGYDALGDPTTDPRKILDGGAIRTFDRSYKGSALALMVEILGGALAGGAVEDKGAARNWGSLVTAIDPASLGGAAAFRARVSALLRRIKAARPAPGVSEIRLPGENSAQLAERCRAAGVVPMSSKLYEQLRAAAAAETGRSPSAAAPSSNHDHQTSASPERPSTTYAQQNGAAGGRRGYAMATRLVHAPKVTSDPYGSVSPPLYQTATFEQVSAVECGPYDYSRSGNPTRTQLEAHIAHLEGAARSFAFGSGMAALSAVLRLVRSGEHVVAGDDIYGGTSRLLTRIAPDLGISVSNVDTSDAQALRDAMIPGKTKLVMLESPTNPRMNICDIAGLTAIAHEGGALVVVDNSILAPTFQQPLALGADIVMTSATKFIAGHSDVTGGLLSVKDPELAERVYFYQNAEGSALGPFDCWLAMRGLKTMVLRMERQATTAALIARWLQAHPLVRKVNYPGLPSHPGHAVHAAQASSGGSLLSFETGSVEASRVIAEEAELFKITVSFGSCSSLISLPCYMSHASIPAALRAARGLPDDLVRISVGIEDPSDLLADLDRAMRKAMEKIGMEAAVPGFDLHEGQTGAQRERQLLQRIAQLEAQLQQT
ncbi:g8069 [Coccomyxa elongata]